MIIRTVIFIFNLLNLFLFFRLLLGCEFRKTRSSVIIGTLIVIGLFVISMPWLDDFLTPYPNFSIILLALLPTTCLKGRKLNLFCLGVALFSLMAPINDLIDGIVMVTLQGKMDFDDFQMYFALSRAVAAVILIGLSCYMRRFRSTLNEVANNISIFAPVFFVITTYLSRWEWVYLGPNMNQDEQMIYQGWNTINNAVVSMIFASLIIALISIFYQRKRLKREIMLKEKCIAEQVEQYEFMGKANKESQKFRHDFNRHMDMLADLFACGQTDELGAYIRQLSDIKERTYYINTGNMICDAIVNRYYVKCREARISLKCSGSFPDDLSVEITDLCILMSNAIENAYEATIHCEENREIRCKIGNIKGTIFITLINPVLVPPVIEDGFIKTSKGDVQDHGFGTKNMQEAAMRNGGTVRWKCDEKNGIVETKICLIDKNL